MQKTLLFVFALLGAVHSWAHGVVVPQKVDSSIGEVTVFLQGAQVTRHALCTLSAGTTTLLFSGISPKIDVQSIQLTVADPNVTLLSVQHQMNYLVPPTPRTEIVRLRETYRSLDEQRKRTMVGINLCKNEHNLLLNNQTIGGANSGLRAADLREVVEYQRSRMEQNQLKMLELNTQIQALNDTISKIEWQLADFNEQKKQQTSEILVTVSANAPIATAFSVRYWVQQASWNAAYDLRAKDINSPIELQYKANLQQQSGEDWKDVQLTLSTANPTLGGTRPTLPPWLLQFGSTYTGYRIPPATNSASAYYNNRGAISGTVTDAINGESIIFATIMASMGDKVVASTQTDFDGNYLLSSLPAGNYSLQVSLVGYITYNSPSITVYTNQTTFNHINLSENTAMLEEVVISDKVRLRDSDDGVTKMSKSMSKSSVASIPAKENYTTPATQAIQNSVSAAQVNENPTNISFAIRLPYTIPNDGKSYTVEVNRYEVPASYRYYCVPKLDVDAFLTAEITQWEQLNLLSGEANLFFEGTFVGKSMLNPHKTQDTLFLSLGRDKSIVVERTMQQTYQKRAIIGSNRTETRVFDIAVRNKKRQAVQLTIEDQYPLSSDKQISISAETDNNALQNERTGSVVWHLNLPPATEKKLQLRYEVKYPKDRSLVLE